MAKRDVQRWVNEMVWLILERDESLAFDKARMKRMFMGPNFMRSVKKWVFQESDAVVEEKVFNPAWAEIQDVLAANE